MLFILVYLRTIGYSRRKLKLCYMWLACGHTIKWNLLLKGSLDAMSHSILKTNIELICWVEELLLIEFSKCYFGSLLPLPCCWLGLVA